MKLLFVDLDETLLNTDKSISKENLDAIERMRAAGHGFVINTGRPLLSAMKIAKRYGFDKEGCFISAFNGSQIIKADTQETLFKTGVKKEYARHIFDEAKKFNIHTHTYTDQFVVSEEKTDMLLKYCRDVDMEYKVVDDAVMFVEGELPKIICADLADRDKLEDFKKYIAPYVDGLMYNLFSNPRLLEFGSLKASKGIAIEILADELGVDMADTYGVGDEENDIEMIKSAGNGFAMINGRDSVKAVADFITQKDNNHGAIAWVIDNYIL